MSYIIRLDDACDKMDVAKWERMERLLLRYEIKPLIGVIPHCEDRDMDKYLRDPLFWDKVKRWEKTGGAIALHGYNHVCTTDCGGLNPVNKRSEFAGVPFEIQKEKIKKGVAILKEHGVVPKVFFAPSHTFDENTLKALEEESDIRIISDTIANKPYSQHGFTFVPQQSGRVRKLPFKTATFCYHPNTMSDKDFEILETFIKKNRNKFIEFPLNETKRELGLFDKLLHHLYFSRR